MLCCPRAGSCDGSPDGLYYVDDKTFAFCSHGRKTVQPCARGSANPPPDHFTHGSYYGLYDFCSVNLVAKGYTGHHYDPARKAVDTGYHGEGDHGDSQAGYTEEVHAGGEYRYQDGASYGYKTEETRQ